MTLPASYYEHDRPDVREFIGPILGRTVLDVGCGSGVMGAALLRDGAARVVGIEKDDYAAAAARSRISKVYQEDLDEWSPRDLGVFERIVCADVLEHLKDPEQTLRELRKCLAPNGRIILSVPNIRHLSVIFDLVVRGDWKYVDAGLLDRTHLRFFTAESLDHLLDETGFEPTRTNAIRAEFPKGLVDDFAALIQKHGGDVERFLEEWSIVQMLVEARSR